MDKIFRQVDGHQANVSTSARQLDRVMRPRRSVISHLPVCQTACNSELRKKLYGIFQEGMASVGAHPVMLRSFIDFTLNGVPAPSEALPLTLQVLEIWIG